MLRVNGDPPGLWLSPLTSLLVTYATFPVRRRRHARPAAAWPVHPSPHRHSRAPPPHRSRSNDVGPISVFSTIEPGAAPSSCSCTSLTPHGSARSRRHTASAAASRSVCAQPNARHPSPMLPPHPPPPPPHFDSLIRHRDRYGAPERSVGLAKAVRSEFASMLLRASARLRRMS